MAQIEQHIEKMDRRKFIHGASLSSLALVLDSHLFSLGLSGNNIDNPAGLLEIKLNTHLDIDAIVAFYHNKLGLPILKKTTSKCSFIAGRSKLSFESIQQNDLAPFYHFAFNIPENKINTAEKWLLNKTSIIQPPEHLHDLKNHTKNVVHFRHWNAHSLFFYDPAGNIVEFIARHTLKNSESGNFTSKDILNISEIGLVVDDVFKSSKELQEKLNWQQYSGASENFRALGNENGLLLFMKKNLKSVFNTGKSRSVFKTEVFLNHQKKSFSFSEDYPYSIY